MGKSDPAVLPSNSGCNLSRTGNFIFFKKNSRTLTPTKEIQGVPHVNTLMNVRTHAVLIVTNQEDSPSFLSLLE